MKIRIRQTLLLIVAGVALRAEYRIGETGIPTVKIQPDSADFAVHPGHPRLFFRESDLPAIRARIAGDYRAEWEQMTRYLETQGLAKPPGDFARQPFLKDWEIVRNIALVAAVTGDERYVRWAREWAAKLAAAGPVGNDTEYRARLQCLAVAYDWLYPWLTAEEKRTLQEAILAHIDHAWHFATENTNYIGGHSRWGNFALTAGVLALISERPELRDRLLLLRDHWIHGYFPVQGWIAQEGGYHMGWAYSAAYLTASIHYVWSTATNECVFFPWQAKIPLFWIYGRQGDGHYPNTGDAYTVTDDLNAYQSDLLILAAGVLKDPRAAWALRDRSNRFADILYGDKRVVPRAPDNPPSPLPLSRHFQNAGVVIARDRWDENSTVLHFSCTPFYSTNHLHRDANAFTLHYRGGLAIDSGLYDESGAKQGGYGGEHWRNYFTRTIAHNAIVVFDPTQKMHVLDKPAANDGGQIFQTDPTRLADIQPGGRAAMPGITRYVATEDYIYAAGDASKAYDPGRVRLAQREIVYLRRTDRAHPVVVVFDRVESSDSAFRKAFLLHTVNEPKVTDNMTVAKNREGRLTAVTLLPRGAELKLIGGPGREAWVDGKNYPWDDTAKPRPGREPGAWRLEVSPPLVQTRDHFLHVLFVDDADAQPVAVNAAQLVESADGAAVQVAGWEIFFPFAPGMPARITPARNP